MSFVCTFQTKTMKVLGWVLYPFFACRCDVPADIAAMDEPVVFVSNHYEIFGPAALALSLPFRYRFWSNAMVLEATRNIDSMVVGTQHALPFLKERTIRGLLKSMTPAVERLLKQFRPVAVYQTNLGKQRRAIEQTVDAMLDGDHVLVFPETAIPAYSHGRVTEFFRSFALIGEVYRRRTGRHAVFCPLYVDKKHRKICFGQPVRYGDGSAPAECERIVHEVRSQILAMADRALGPCAEKEVCVSGAGGV